MRQPLDFDALFPEASLIRNAELREKVERIWQQLWQEGQWDDIEDLQVAPSIPYPHIKHNQAIVKCAVAMADIFEEVHGIQLDRDLLIAAALLQDSSKLVEYQPRQDGAPGCELSNIGKSLQHAFYAAHLALAEGLPTELAHMIITHSPQSAMGPKRKEVQILHHIDQADVAMIHDRPIFKRTVIEQLA